MRIHIDLLEESCGLKFAQRAAEGLQESPNNISVQIRIGIHTDHVERPASSDLCFGRPKPPKAKYQILTRSYLVGGPAVSDWPPTDGARQRSSENNKDNNGERDSKEKARQAPTEEGRAVTSD